MLFFFSLLFFFLLFVFFLFSSFSSRPFSVCTKCQPNENLSLIPLSVSRRVSVSSLCECSSPPAPPNSNSTTTHQNHQKKPDEAAADAPGGAAKAPQAAAIELPKLRKVSIAPKEEPVKKEVKKTKVKIPKAKKYEELPEIPDYERPELEKYEASDFDPTVRQHEPLKHAVPTAAAADASQPQQATVGQTPPEPKKNGVPKVGFSVLCFGPFPTLLPPPPPVKMSSLSIARKCFVFVCRTITAPHRVHPCFAARRGADQTGAGQGTAARADRCR